MNEKNELFRIKRAATGLGLFAARDIPKETRIVEYTGDKIPNTDSKRMKGKYLFTLNNRYTIDGSPRSNTGRYANHSCRPNAYTEIIRGKIWIIAKRKIKAGEEITYDYGKAYFEDFIKPSGCKCVKCSTDKYRKRARL